MATVSGPLDWGDPEESLSRTRSSTYADVHGQLLPVLRDFMMREWLEYEMRTSVRTGDYLDQLFRHAFRERMRLREC